MENHVKYGDSIYYYNDSTLYVNLFIPSVLDFRDKGLTVTQQTRYPLDGNVQLRLAADKPVNLAVKIRRPHWAGDDVELTVDGKAYSVNAPAGDYMTIARTWDKSGEIRLALPMKLRSEAMPDDPRKVAFFSGPILLAGALGKEGIEDIDPHAEKRNKFDHVSSPPIPVLVVGDRTTNEYIRPTDEPGTFVIDRSALKTPGSDKAEDITLIPFYKMHYQRYLVYWDLFSREDWARIKDEFEAEQARIKAVEANTIDHMVPGRMQDERDHNLEGEKTYKGLFRDRHWRDARGGGWFSFEMKVVPDMPAKLVCVYWGSDGPGRDFDILVDDDKIASEHLNQNHPGQFFTAMYDIPEQLTKGKNKVTIKFKAHPWRTAGGLFECRTIRKD
jgi:hypothetical protein